MRFTISLLVCIALTACTPTIQEPVDAPSSATSSVVTSTEASNTTASQPSAAQNTTGLPLSIPDGFSMEILARDLAGARDIAKDGFGNYWVSQPSQGRVTQLEMQDGKLVRQNAIFRDMRGPHGLAINPANGTELYIAEEHRIIRAHLYSDAPIEEVAKLPGTGRHSTRSLEIGSDGRLYVSIGSTCDVCVEDNEEHGSIISMKLDGTDRKIFARGLRNSVFMTKHPSTQEIWATDMGRDRLGDHLPPEEVNIIKEAHYGWPFCYGDRVRDQSFQPANNFDCAITESPRATLPAHIAPLGLAFIPSSWPADMRGDLLVAAHGSWNSSVPVGYKIFRIPFSADGRQEGPGVDFISGWHTGSSVLGRPVDVMFDGGDLLVTDDKAGVVYRVQY
jgi:glucose/arabinose dehydrogenase